MNSLPEKFVEKLPHFIPQEKLQEVMKSFAVKPLPSFRVNTLKSSLQEVTRVLQEQEFVLQHVSWYSDAFVLQNKSQKDLIDSDVYKNGSIYLQGLSSMIPALVLDPKPRERVLDLCAAPGSKTSQMATMMNNTGEIIANDTSRQRLYKMQQIMHEQGVTNVKTTLFPGQALWKKYPEYFDKVLVDAPCTMEGRFQTNDPSTYRDWKPKKVKMLAKLQQYLLRSAISATKIGGTVVYSTCTLSPEENEEVIDWVLQKEGNAIVIEPISLSDINFEPGITNWKKELNESIKDTARIYPSETMEGFFIAKIKKLQSTAGNAVKYI